MLLIRPLIKSMYPALVSLDARAFGAIGQKSVSSMDVVVGVKAGTQVACLYDSQDNPFRMLGYCGWQRIERREVLLTRMAIDPDFQRKGLGSELLLDFLTTRHRQVRRIHTYVHEDNFGAAKFFCHAGFTFEESVPQVYGQRSGFRYALGN